MSDMNETPMGAPVEAPEEEKDEMGNPIVKPEDGDEEGEKPETDEAAPTM